MTEEDTNIGNEDIKKEAQDIYNEENINNPKSESLESKESEDINENSGVGTQESESSSEDDESDDFDIGEEYDEDKVASEPSKQQQEDPEYEQIKNQLQSLTQELKNNQRFPRVESKPEFASGVLNSETVKRVGNLSDEDIEDLLNKRKFYNFLKFIGWDQVADDRVFPLIQDIEDYSLSKKGRLLDSVFIDRAKQESLSYEKNPPKGGKVKDDR